MVRYQTIFGFMLFGMISCGSELRYETLEEDAARFCEALIQCNTLPEPEKYKAKCENNLLDESEVGLEEGVNCANGYADLLRCLSHLSCREYEQDWTLNYTSWNSAVEYKCKAENKVFDNHCGKTFGAENVGP